jgi:uncharacterized protein (DUF362 family)
MLNSVFTAEVTMTPRWISRRDMLRLAAVAPACAPLAAQNVAPATPRSTVALIKGDNRRKNIAAAMEAIDDQIRPVLRTKKNVVIKVNNVSTQIQLAASHADAIHGILDYLEPRFKGPVHLVESSAGDTMVGFENFKYTRVRDERKINLIDLNREAKYKIVPMINYDLHAQPCRMAARLFDPEAYIISACMLKTHNVVVATLSIKNMSLGAPLHGVGERWNDKRVVHNGLRQTQYNIFLGAQAMKPYWNLAVIDGYEGMEGNGPSSGNPVPSRVAIASTDYVAADRVGVDAMGINPDWMGYLKWCAEFGIGNFDSAKIDIRGEKVASVVKKYQLHADIERELEWMGPIQELPKKIG